MPTPPDDPAPAEDEASGPPASEVAPVAAADLERRAAVPLYLLLWLVTVVAAAAQAKVPDELVGDSWRAYASFFVLVTALLGTALLVDGLLLGARKRAVLAGVACVVSTFTVVSTVFLRTTSIPLTAGLGQLAQGAAPFDMLREVELGSLAEGLAALVPLSLLGGALLARVRTAFGPRWLRGAIVGVALLWGGFVVEQMHARRSSSTYFMRVFILPLYWQLFDGEDDAEVIVIAIAPPSDAAARERALGRIGPARNPKHVLIVGLESVEPEVIRPDISPHMARLRGESLDFPNAYGVSIYTALSWVSILLDRPAVSALTDLLGKPGGDSAWPLAVFSAAGYRIHLAFSGNLIWGEDTTRRIEGDARQVVQHLVHHPDEQKLQRHIADDEVTARMVRWIEEADPSSPQLFLLQLDSTHWNYHFHPELAVERDYPDAVDPRELTSQAKLDGVRRRYLNAVNHVDRKVGEVIAALERKGMLADTAIVVLSDHGEGFSVGRAGHMALCRDSQRIPFFLRLPGQPPRADPRLVDQRRLWPLLAEYLAIEGLGPGTFQTSSSWSGDAVFSAGLHVGDLVLRDGIIRFRIKRSDGQVSLHPIASVDEDGAVRGDPGPILRSFPWRETIRELIDGRAAR